jgi:Protein of unknown function (DUF3168)
MEKGLTTKLLATSGVTALVSDRVYPGRRPQASPLPAITLSTISGGPVYTNDGETGLATARVQIDCWGSTWTSAKEVARAVTAALSAFFGESDGTTFQYVLLDSEREFSEGGSNNAEYLYRRDLDFTVWYEN